MTFYTTPQRLWHKEAVAPGGTGTAKEGGITGGPSPKQVGPYQYIQSPSTFHQGGYIGNRIALNAFGVGGDYGDYGYTVYKTPSISTQSASPNIQFRALASCVPFQASSIDGITLETSQGDDTNSETWLDADKNIHYVMAAYTDPSSEIHSFYLREGTDPNEVGKDLNSRVPGWDSTCQVHSIYALSASLAYIFVARTVSGNVCVWMTKYNGSTFSALTRITDLTGVVANSIYRITVTKVGAGQATKIFLLVGRSTVGDTEVYVWDYSTEAEVSVAFVENDFFVPKAKSDPINISGVYYHFLEKDGAGGNFQRWEYTSANYSNPTRVAIPFGGNPTGYDNLAYLGATVEYNDSTNECKLVAHFTGRAGDNESGQRSYIFKYADALSFTSWSSQFVSIKRAIHPWDLENPNNDAFTYDYEMFEGVSISAYGYGSNNIPSVVSAGFYHPPSAVTIDEFLWDYACINFWSDGGPFNVDASVICDLGDDVYINAAVDPSATVQCTIDAQVVIVDELVTQYDDLYLYYELEVQFNDGAVNCNLDDACVIAGDVGDIPVKDLSLQYFVHGYSWHEAVLGIINTKREEYGLPPYRLFSLEQYLAIENISETHANNMVATRTYEHEDPVFPFGYRTLGERRAHTGAASLGENNLLSFSTEYINPNDDNFLTPEAAFEAWWESPPHRENILRDWGNEEIYSLMGFSLGLTPLNIGLGPEWADQYAWYFCHVMLSYGPSGAGVMDRYLHLSYDLTGALVEYVVESYDIVTYTAVTAVHEAKYSTRVGVEHSALYGAMVATQHEAPIHYGISAFHSAPYVGSLNLRQNHILIYSVKETDTVKQEHSSNWSTRLAYVHEAPYSQPARVIANNSAPYDEVVKVRVEHLGVYSNSIEVRNGHTSIYSVYGQVNVSHTAPYISSVTVGQDFSSLYDILGVELVRTQHTAFWSLSTGDAQVVDSSAYLIVGGSTILLDDVVVSHAESGYFWEAQLRLKKMEDYALMVEETEFDLVIGSDTYSLIVTARSLRRDSLVGVDLQVSALSPGAKFDTPRAVESSYSFDSPMLASEIADAILGESVDWSAVDWLLPANRVQFEDVTPLGALVVLAEAAGAIVQSHPDGQILVRPKFPITLADYATVTPDQVFTDNEDNLSVSEDYAFNDGYTKFRIREGESTFGDSIEWIVDETDPSKGVLKVFPSPWRDTFSVRNTGISPQVVSISSLGVVQLEVTELLEFRQGQANTSYPIKTLGVVEWLSESLGSVSFTSYARGLSTATVVNEGYGLAQVTYIYESYDYSVIGVLGAKVQFVVEDISND